MPVIGAPVTLAGRPGTVTGLGPGDLVEVEVEVELTKLRRRPYFGCTSYIQRHVCPAWRLWQEN